MTSSETNQDICVVAAEVGPEKYVIIYDEQREEEALQTIGRWASDPSLEFNWKDAAKMIRCGIAKNRRRK